MDVEFHVPGDLATPAGVTAFGAVFTDVDSATSTKLQFFTPDGVLLYERFVPAAAGSETLSFLGVRFNAGEVVGRVRIVSGNAALGVTEAGTVDVVAMDDFIYAEPVRHGRPDDRPRVDHACSGPARFDLVIAIGGYAAPLVTGRIIYDGLDVTASLLGCLRPGTLGGGGITFRCAVPGSLLAAGDHVLQVEAGLRRRVATPQRHPVGGRANTEP